MKKILYTMTALFMLSANSAFAQVTIGSLADPQSFSILELEGKGERGLRLPQLSNANKIAAFGTDNSVLIDAGDDALGLQIFNIDTKCVETWNGVEWILACDCGDHPCPKPNKAEDVPQPTWSATAQWVGAFWRDDQTGERIIASKNTLSVVWTASIDNEGTTGSWLTLDGNGGYDPNLWTDNPDDAENHKLPAATRKTSVNGTGNILFRIGAVSKNTDTNTDYDTGIKPRYATVNLKVGTTDYKIYCRQGHSADYVFRKSDNATSGSYTGERTLAVKFSPYNLTASGLDDNSPYYKDIDNGSSGIFVDYPTQIGAFFQWASTLHFRRAYHPTVTTSISNDWEDESLSGYWTSSYDTRKKNETCPSGWRRPAAGATNAVTNANAIDSELMQSLFYTTVNGPSRSNHSDNYRYRGYYADGYFDRRQITASATGMASSAVSKDTKDAAYIGLLFTNPDSDSGASLFMPAGGFRSYMDGSFNTSGNSCYYWSSSSLTVIFGWSLAFFNSYAEQENSDRSCGFAVRCVVDEE